jgi:hypothetical protein
MSEGVSARLGGDQSEAASLRLVLERMGVAARHSQGAIPEALIFAIGGGIGFGYLVFDMGGRKSAYLGARFHTKEATKPEFLGAICERLGVQGVVQKAAHFDLAEKKLIKALDQGRAVIVWVDRGLLPYLNPFGRANAYHTIVALGRRRDGFDVADISSCPLTLTTEELREAQSTSWSPKFRSMLVEAPAGPLSIEGAVRDGLRATCDQMLRPPMSSFGLDGFVKVAGSIVNARDKKAWPKFFPPGLAMFKSLVSLFEQIETRGRDGGAFRGLYADSLDQAADVLSVSALRDVAATFRKSAEVWHALAVDLLPDAAPPLRETRDLLLEKHRLFLDSGTAERERMLAINRRLSEIMSDMDEHFPLAQDEVDGFRNTLRDRFLEIHQLERDGISSLQEAVR